MKKEGEGVKRKRSFWIVPGVIMKRARYHGAFSNPSSSSLHPDCYSDSDSDSDPDPDSHCHPLPLPPPPSFPFSHHLTPLECYHKPCTTDRPHSRFHSSERHYYANGAWRHPTNTRESRYSDFVPCAYDERTLITKLYNYARTLLLQTNGRLLYKSPFFSGSGSGGSSSQTQSQTDFEMITSTPSPTLHASIASSSPRAALQSRGHNGSYRFPSSTPPHSTIKAPPAAALPRQLPRSPAFAANPHKRAWSVSTQSSSVTPAKVTVDVGTQYSPLLAPVQSPVSHPSSLGKRRDMSVSPKVPPEPALEPQMIFKHTDTPSSYQPTSASSITLAKTSSAASSSSQGSSPKRSRQAKPAVKEMPEQYETCDVKDLVVLISNMLMELVRFNDDIPLKDGRLTRFHSRAPPAISVKDYLQRLTTHATLSPPILLSMVYYIDRLCALYPAFTISSLTVHRFLITSATVASKGLSDSFWTNNTYARVGGVRLKELALLELEFLWRVEWRIVPKPEVLVDYYRSLVERSEGYKIEERKSGEIKAGTATRMEESEDSIKEAPKDDLSTQSHNSPSI